MQRPAARPYGNAARPAAPAPAPAGRLRPRTAPAPAAGGGGRSKSKVITAIIVIGAMVAGVAIGGTVFNLI